MPGNCARVIFTQNEAFQPFFQKYHQDVDQDQQNVGPGFDSNCL